MTGLPSKTAVTTLGICDAKIQKKFLEIACEYLDLKSNIGIHKHRTGTKNYFN
jgi:hypothetical protein